jgi:hypothetical protein
LQEDGTAFKLSSMLSFGRYGDAVETKVIRISWRSFINDWNSKWSAQMRTPAASFDFKYFEPDPSKTPASFSRMVDALSIWLTFFS